MFAMDLTMFRIRSIIALLPPFAILFNSVRSVQAEPRSQTWLSFLPSRTGHPIVQTARIAS